MIKIWLDDIRIAPTDYIHCSSVNEVKEQILIAENNGEPIMLNLDHDLGHFAKKGGDGIELMNWLERTGRFYPVHFHTQNPVGLLNMQRVMKKYPQWMEI